MLKRINFILLTKLNSLIWWRCSCKPKLQMCGKKVSWCHIFKCDVRNVKPFLTECLFTVSTNVGRDILTIDKGQFCLNLNVFKEYYIFFCIVLRKPISSHKFCFLLFLQLVGHEHTPNTNDTISWDCPDLKKPETQHTPISQIYYHTPFPKAEQTG